MDILHLPRDVLNSIFRILLDNVGDKQGPIPHVHDPISNAELMKDLQSIVSCSHVCKLFYSYMHPHIKKYKNMYSDTETKVLYYVSVYRLYRHGIFQYRRIADVDVSCRKYNDVEINTSYRGVDLTLLMSPISNYLPHGILHIYYARNSNKVKLTIEMKFTDYYGFNRTVVNIYIYMYTAGSYMHHHKIVHTIDDACKFIPYCNITEDFVEAFTSRERSVREFVDLYNMVLDTI